MYIYVWQGGGPGRPIGDVQTDVHIVPVDSDSPLRNLFKVRTRAEWIKKKNLKASKFMETQGWSLGGDDNAKAELMNIVQAFMASP